EPGADGRPQLLQPGRVEEPLARALRGAEALVELVGREQRPRGEVDSADRRPHRRMDDRGGISAVEQPEAVEVERARRGGVEDAPAAERRAVAQDEAVTARRDDGRREAELRVGLAGPDDAGDAP